MDEAYEEAALDPKDLVGKPVTIAGRGRVGTVIHAERSEVHEGVYVTLHLDKAVGGLPAEIKVGFFSSEA